MNVKKILENLKEPTLIYKLKTHQTHLPNTLSHIGGTPYSEEQDRLPVCRICKHSLKFVFQLNIPVNQNESELHCFYYCFSCNIENGNKGFEMKTYKNPSLSKLVKRDQWRSSIAYAEFEFEPHWSLPEWDSLPFINKDIQKTFLKEYKEDAEMEYEQLSEDMLRNLHFDSFSFFGGYAKFLGFASYPACPHCGEHMELFMQLDSEDDKSLVWSDFGCLYIFRCKTQKDQFYILIQ